MIRALTPLLAATILCTALTGPTHAGEIDKRIVPGNSKWLFHVDVEQLKASQFGQLLLLHPQVAQMRRRTAEAGAAWGLDPIEDIRSVTGFGPKYQDTHGVIAITVDADLEQMEQVAMMAEDYELLSYGAFEIHSFVHEDKDGRKARAYVGVHEPVNQKNTMLIASEHLEYVKQTLDTIAGKAESIAKSRDSVLATAPIKGAFTFVAAENVKPPAGDGGAMIWKRVDQVVLSMGEYEGSVRVDLALTTKTEEDATQMHTAATGLMALVQMSDDPAHQPMVEFINAIDLGLDGKQVTVRFAYPARDLFEALEAHHEAKRAEFGAGHDDDAGGGEE